MSIRNDHGNNMSCEKHFAKNANTTTFKCGGWGLGHFATKNTHEKAIQT